MEKMNAQVAAVAAVLRQSAHPEAMDAHGRYHVECRGSDGELKWADYVENVVCTEGKNFALDQILGGKKPAGGKAKSAQLQAVQQAHVALGERRQAHLDRTGCIHGGSLQDAQRPHPVQAVVHAERNAFHGGAGEACLQMIAGGVGLAQRESISIREAAGRVLAETRAQGKRLPASRARLRGWQPTFLDVLHPQLRVFESLLEGLVEIL